MAEIQNKDGVIKQIDDIYLIISALNVSGDAVDMIAAARSKLRKLRADMEAAKKGKATDAGQDGQ